MTLTKLTMNVYNIIWADDECDTLCSDYAVVKLFDRYGIEVIDSCHTSEELRRSLTTFSDSVDAVVVDGNFSRDDVEYLESDDISGLVHTMSLIELFNIKRDIPFFLYTGRKNLLMQICKNGELTYFNKNDRIIQKGDIESLASRIASAVDKISSPEHHVIKRFLPLLKEAREISPKMEDELRMFLLAEEKDTRCDKAVDQFTHLRKMLEIIVDLCKDYEIIPRTNTQLNDTKYFLSKNGHANGSKPKENVWPAAIVSYIWSMTDILQDGSHNIKDLNLHVSEYVFESSSPYLFRSCLYQVMELIRWYKETEKKMIDGKLIPPLYTIDQEKEKKFQANKNSPTLAGGG